MLSMSLFTYKAFSNPRHQDIRSRKGSRCYMRIIFKSTMSLAGFSCLLCCIRFDEDHYIVDTETGVALRLTECIERLVSIFTVHWNLFWNWSSKSYVCRYLKKSKLIESDLWSHQFLG